MCFSSDSHAKRIAQLLAEAAGRRRPRYFVVRAWGRLAQTAHRAFSLSSVVPIESTTVVMRDGRLIPPTLLIPVTAES
jgi:hypothetical protein